MEDTTKRKVIVHCCGGAAVRIGATQVHPFLDKLPENGFSEIELQYIDASMADISQYSNIKNKYIIQSEKIGQIIAGSGGETSTHWEDILPAVDKYVNERKYIKPVTGELHIVLTSAGGGTGRGIALALTKVLLSRDIPVMSIPIIDSHTMLYAEQSQKTLQSLDGIPRKEKKVLPIYLVSNDDGELKADAEVVRSIIHISMFNNSINKSLDAKDMEKFLAPATYTNLPIPHGAFRLEIHKHMINAPADEMIILGRALAVEKEEPFKLSHSAWQFKTGYFSSPLLLDFVQQDSSNPQLETPIYLLLRQNRLTDTFETLRKKVTVNKQSMSSVTISQLVDENHKSDEDGFSI